MRYALFVREGNPWEPFCETLSVEGQQGLRCMTRKLKPIIRGFEAVILCSPERLLRRSALTLAGILLVPCETSPVLERDLEVYQPTRSFLRARQEQVVIMVGDVTQCLELPWRLFGDVHTTRLTTPRPNHLHRGEIVAVEADRGHIIIIRKDDYTPLTAMLG